jgi:hypothetical protein
MSSTMLLWLGAGVLIYSLAAIAVGLWALISHRERVYKDRKAEFDAQLNRVSQRLNQTRNTRRSP